MSDGEAKQEQKQAPNIDSAIAEIHSLTSFLRSEIYGCHNIIREQKKIIDELKKQIPAKDIGPQSEG